MSADGLLRARSSATSTRAWASRVVGALALAVVLSCTRAGRADDGARSDPPEDPPVPHPVFAVLTASAELGALYLGGVGLAVLTNPVASGVSIGGSLFVAPLTNVSDRCGSASSCNLAPVLARGMALVRLGSAYRADIPGLAWVELGAGVTYLAEPQLYPSPGGAIAGGADVRLSGALWFEAALRGTAAVILGPDSPFSGAYFTLGFEAGVRFDIVR